MNGDEASLLARTDLAGMLATAVGTEKAQALVESTCQSLGLVGDPLVESDAHRVLASMAEQDGIVGLAAALAKSRLHFSKAVGATRSHRGTTA